MAGTQSVTSRLFPGLGWLLCVAAAVRLPGLFLAPLWSDEAATYFFAKWPISVMFWCPTDPNPFLFYALHQLIVGDFGPPALARLVSWLAGVASVLVVFLLGRRIGGTRFGFSAGILLAVSNIAIYYSVEARAYSLTLFLTLSMTWSLSEFFYAQRQGERLRWLVVYAMASVLAFYTHLIAGYWIIASGLILAFSALRQRDRLPVVVATFALMAVCAAPGLFRLRQQIAVGYTFQWLEQATPMRFVSNMSEVLMPVGLADMQLVAVHSLSNLVKVVLLAMAFTLIAWLVLKRDKAARITPPIEVVLLIWAYLFLPLLIWGQGYLAKPMFMARTVLFCLPGFVLAFAWLLNLVPAEIGRRVLAAWSAVSVAAIAATGFAMPRSDWVAANAILAAKAAPGDAILVEPSYDYGPLRMEAHAPLSGVAGIVLEKQPRLVEPEFGGNRHWLDREFAQLAMPQFRAQAGLPPPQPVAPVNWRKYKRIWLVTRECRTNSGLPATKAWTDGRRRICLMLGRI